MIRPLCLLFVLAAVQVVVAEDAPLPNPSDLHFKGYADAPEFTVLARKKHLKHYPCAQCHQFMEPNPKVRELASPHPNELNHGEGRLWCLVCHHSEDRNNLRTQLNEKVDFNDAHLVCGGCHAKIHQDWYYGAHGKRVRNWQGKRQLFNCTECHNPHEPTIKARKPQPPPPVRVGLKRQQGQVHPVKRIWEQRGNSHEEDSHAQH